MPQRTLTFRLPPPALGEATFVTDYGLRGGQLFVDGAAVLSAVSNDDLLRGIEGTFGPDDRRALVRADDDFDVRLWVDGLEAPRSDQARTGLANRGAWAHGVLSLVASACGFAASWFYVLRARESGAAWDMKMALHMAGWHALLTLTLPAGAIWGGRVGLVAVRFTAAVFFLIHVGIALANTGPARDGVWVALLNAASGLAFLATGLAPAPRPRAE